MASTVPANGDVNPYGIVSVPMSTGNLVAGDTLDLQLQRGLEPAGDGHDDRADFAGGHADRLRPHPPLPAARPLSGRCRPHHGTDRARRRVRGRGQPAGDRRRNGHPEAGCLIVLDPEGQPVETWAGNQINGPWDLALVPSGNTDELFVTNVLNKTVAAAGQPVNGGTVVRLDVTTPNGKPPVLFSSTTVAQGFTEQLNSSALVLGPTGDAVNHSGTLYVADTMNNRIAVIPDATTRTTPMLGGGYTLSYGGSLNAPLGMALAPNGDILTVNGGDGNAVETTPLGKQVDTVADRPAQRRRRSVRVDRGAQPRRRALRRRRRQHPEAVRPRLNDRPDGLVDRIRAGRLERLHRLGRPARQPKTVRVERGLAHGRDSGSWQRSG